uniref:paramyosin n=1 Tax=Erigeron canadensis TaxID=72917 RepID=UPI001CB94B3D|nr:paramyosin [Erigeron canadensis]
MASHHASLGRRTLEEIRQKRAAQKISKTASGPDLTLPPNPTEVFGIKKSSSGSGISESDISGLVAQLVELQKKNVELDEENKKLSSELRSNEAENDVLRKRVHDLEQNTVPSLRRALKDVAMEKDAAVVAKEDFSAQVRVLKKRLKEAEQEQYRAEEDAAALRAELNSLQQQAMDGDRGAMSSRGGPPDHLQHIEKELADLKSQLEQESMLRRQEGMLRRQEQQQLAEEQMRIFAIMSEKEELEEKLAAMSREASGTAERGAQLTMEDKERLEKQLHDMAVVVERLESSRQKLLLEIDSQSSELERLFEENSTLSSAYQEATGMLAHWENQVKDCLKQNADLRSMLDKLRTEQASIPVVNESHGLESNKEVGSEGHTTEVVSLKGQLAKEQSKSETLSAEVLQLSAQLQQSIQAYNGLARLYKPVLRNIESNLLRMKQDGSLTVQ